MKKFLRSSYSTVFVMLGSACNLQCKYCIQHDIVCESLENEINPDVIEFIREIAQSQKKKLRVLFYGGEPLLYIPTIKKFIASLKGENVQFCMISNGKRLDSEIVKYINENEVHIAVSWDGESSIKTRGFDVVKEKREQLLALRNLCITGVLSAENYIQDYFDSLDKIDKEYFARNGYHIACNVDEIMGHGDLTKIDMEKMKEQTVEICQSYLNSFRGEVQISPMREQFIISMVKRLASAQRESMMSCGNGYNVLNVDLEGNLYRCHNTHDKVGTIYDCYLNYLNNVIAYDNARRDYCKECPVYGLCRGGCPLVNDAQRVAYYCGLKQAVYFPVLCLVDILLQEGSA